MLNIPFLRRRPDPTAERLKIAEETIARTMKAADRPHGEITEVRSVLEAGRKRLMLHGEKKGRI
ncbi:MAG: hypothetical protein ACYDG4_13415 [Desulfuromonadaceae bacterium]